MLFLRSLETNMRSLSDENRDLAEKLVECEASVTEYRIYRSCCEDCDAEKTALANSLEEASAENNNLVNKISLLHDELEKINTESDELLSSKHNLLKLVNFLQQKLHTMFSGHDEKSDGISLSHEFLDANRELKTIADSLLLLEYHQNVASEQRLQLMKEKEGIEEERDIVNVSLAARNSEFEALRKKFELGIGDRTCKLEAFNLDMDNIQAKLDNVCERLKLSVAEESYAGIKEEILSDISHMETQLHELSGVCVHSSISSAENSLLA